ncbi:MAG: MerR family transcriptional regulator [Gammaproteobacteria bacterium]
MRTAHPTVASPKLWLRFSLQSGAYEHESGACSRDPGEQCGLSEGLSMSSEYFKIGEVAEMLNTTTRTIRYYEEEGLITPDRSRGGTRLYSEHHIDRLKAVLHLAENGFSLDVIGLIGIARQSCSTGDEGSQKLSLIIDTAVSDIEEKIAELNVLKSELEASGRLVAQCRGCLNEPSSRGCPACPLNRNLNKIEILNLIWE